MINRERLRYRSFTPELLQQSVLSISTPALLGTTVDTKRSVPIFTNPSRVPRVDPWLALIISPTEPTPITAYYRKSVMPSFVIVLWQRVSSRRSGARHGGSPPSPANARAALAVFPSAAIWIFPPLFCLARSFPSSYALPFLFGPSRILDETLVSHHCSHFRAVLLSSFHRRYC